MNENRTCLICDKHKGLSHHPPGDYIYRGAYFSVCHAPIDKGPLGTLFIESDRHLLDYADMNPDELRAYSILLSSVYRHLKELTSAERVYQVTLLEGIPHFHTWLVPRRKSDPERGTHFLMRDITCKIEDVNVLVAGLRKALTNNLS